MNETSYIRYRYDKKNRITKKTYSTKGSRRSTEIVTVYDGDNYRESTYDGRNLLVKFEENEVKDGLLRKKKKFNRIQLKSYVVYTYDANRNLIRMDTFAIGATIPSNSEEWAYDCN